MRYHWAMTQPYSDDDRLRALRRLVANEDNVSKTVRELRAEGMRLTRETLIDWRRAVLERVDAAPQEAVSAFVSDTLALSADTPDTRPIEVRLVEQIAHTAFGHLRDVASWDADGKLTFIPSDQLSAAASSTIQSITYEVEEDLVGEGEHATVIRTTKKSIKRESGLGAQALLAKILGLISGGPAVTVNNDNRTLVLPQMSLEEHRAMLAKLVGEP